MREIKFRAWDKKDKAMREVVGIDFISKSVLLANILPNIKIESYRRNFSDVVLMEYIGIKDALGNEIYEGDVIENRENGDKINFGHGQCWIFDTRRLKKYRVIGNVFENPELVSGL